MIRQNNKSSKTGLYLFFLLVLTVTPLVFSATPVSAAITWSDDFNDGNYDEWTIKGMYLPIGSDWVDTAGKADIVNDELMFTGQQIFRNSTFAVHESSVAYGNWSFDVTVRPIFGSSNHTHIYFIDPKPVEEVPDFGDDFSGYDIKIYSAPWTIEVPDWLESEDDTAPSFLLIKRPGIVILGSYSVDEIDGTQHIEVTRNETGQFKEYINGTLRIEAVNNRWTTSQSFYLTSEAGASFDNIVVSGDPVEPTEVGDALLVPMIAVGGAGAVIIVAALVIWKRRQLG